MNNILNEKIKNKIYKDVLKIEKLIEEQLSIDKYRECPLYQDVIDTQIYGISKELELAVEIGAISLEKSKDILEKLEHKASMLYVENIEKKKVN